MVYDYTPPPAPAPRATAPGCLGYGLFAAAILWICAVVALVSPAAWFAREVVLISGAEWPFWASPVVALVQALLILAPVGLLAALTHTPHLRAAYQTWALACGLLIAFGLARGLPMASTQAALALQALVGLGAALALWLGGRRPAGAGDTPWPVFAAGLAAAALAAIPWLLYGALGSPLDTLLAVAAGAGVGLVAALLLTRWLLPALRADGVTPAAAVGIGGLALGAALLIMAAGAGFEAANLLLIAALPPLGVGAAALAWPFAGAGRAALAPAALVGGVAAATLAFFDPDEVTILLGGSDIPTLAQGAAGWALLAGLAVAGLLWAARPALARLRAPVALGALAAAALVAGGLYAVVGRPGFYGDQLFVILRDQADLGAARRIPGREERLRYVYTTLAGHAEATQAGIRADLDRFGVAYRPYYLVNGLEVDGGPLVRLWLLGRPEVDRVIRSPRLRPLSTPPPPEPGESSPPDEPPWNIAAIGADRVWDELGVTGAGIVIGQSDSGVDLEHPALRDSYRGGAGGDAYNWLDPWYGTASPRDYGMHGTHTLGSALGAGGIGVAPGATWFACANLARNLGNPARYLDCMQFMLAPYAPGADPFHAGDPTRAAHVLNNSWGCPPLEGCDPTSLQPAADALRAAGIFVVASAGNEGAACSSVSDPIAIYDSVFSVGAVDAAGNVTDFSSRGPVDADGSGRTKPDIVAPGADILSSQPGGTYGYADGTSMAGPHVAGVVALLWSANPALVGDIDRTEQILIETAQPYRGAGGLSCAGSEQASNVAGYGIVDAYAAVQAALAGR